MQLNFDIKLSYKGPCKRMQYCWWTTPNIVGCYILLSFAYHCMLSRVVAQSQKLPTFLLFHDRWSAAQQCSMLSQHCWGHAHAFHVVYKVLWVVSFPQCTVGPTLLGVAFAHHCQHWCNNSQNLRIINFSALHVDAIYYNGDNIFNFCPQNLLVKTKTKPAEPP